MLGIIKTSFVVAACALGLAACNTTSPHHVATSSSLYLSGGSGGVGYGYGFNRYYGPSAYYVRPGVRYIRPSGYYNPRRYRPYRGNVKPHRPHRGNHAQPHRPQRGPCKPGRHGRKYC